MISVIIPTYKEPHALDLCLKSATIGAQGVVEYVVITDGTLVENKEVLKKYKKDYDVKIVNFVENQGTPRAINNGVYNAKYSNILIVNDDNVFPDNWDVRLRAGILTNEERGCVITPNQIEPTPSIFNQFYIKDFGRDPNTFDLPEFWAQEKEISYSHIEETGSTFPFFMKKHMFLAVGGYPEDYPSKAGYVADWEFFMKCELVGLKMIRTYNLHFYHFVSLSEQTYDRYKQKQAEEQLCHEHFKYKWGVNSYTNPDTNSKVQRFDLM